MTLDELRMEVKDDFASMGDKLDVLATGMAGLTATLEAQHERRQAEIDALFSRTKETEQRVTRIEVNYTTKTDFDAERKANAEAQKTQNDAIGALQVNVGKVLMVGGGAATLVSAIVTAGLNWLMKG